MIGCLLMSRLGEIGVPVVVLAQYSRAYMTPGVDRTRDIHAIRRVLDCAARAGLVALDEYDPLQRAIEARGIDAIFRTDHHTPQGNRLVAELVLDELVRRNLLPPGERDLAIHRSRGP